MKQKLFLILFCLLGISNVYTQPFKVLFERNPQTKFSTAPFKMSRQQLKAAVSGLYYYGFCDNNRISNGLGLGQTQALSAAIRMPANSYDRKTISTIRIGLNDNCTNVSVWIRSSLSGANLVSQTVGNVNQGWTEINLSTPFTIPAGSDIYIGYTATGYYQMGVSGTSASDGCWIYSDQWENLAYYENGSFCIQAGIDLQGSTVFAAKPESLSQSVQSSPNQSMTIKGSIRNYSSVGITNVKISYQIDNQTPVDQTVSISVASMQTGNINIPINAIVSTGIYNLSVKILEVNGQPNPLADESLNSQIKILSQSFPRKIVVEEGTGTWCGYCPGGAAGMALMKQKYSDTFIGIAVHNNDPMTITAYDNFMTSKFINYFPCAVVDRKRDLMGDPFYSAPNFFQSEMAQTPVAGIQLTGGFVDASKQSIALKAVTIFGVSTESANFRLAYVLIENGVTGYTQRNYYSGKDAMGGYEDKPDPITDMVFDDVARGIYSDPAGIAGSFPTTVTAMSSIENNYTISLPSSIQNKDNLEVAVLLINGTTGEIENADKIAISGDVSSTVAVTGVTLDQTSLSLWVGETQQLTATIAPANATNRNVSRSSDAPSVATVSNTGLITAVGKGTANIKVTTEDGGFIATCTVDVLQQEVIVPNNTQTGSDGKGTIVLSFAIPTDVLFSGSFQLIFPAGVQLDLSATRLMDNLASLLSMNTVQNTDGSRLFTITSLNLFSAAAAYSQIVEIGYMVDKSVAAGTYDAYIRNLSLTFNNGTSITEGEVPVQLTISSLTGIPDWTAGTGAYLYNGKLYVDSPVAEKIQVYSANGMLLYNFQKAEGKATYSINQPEGVMLFVKGGSGWVKKVTR